MQNGNGNDNSDADASPVYADINRHVTCDVTVTWVVWVLELVSSEVLITAARRTVQSAQLYIGC